MNLRTPAVRFAATRTLLMGLCAAATLFFATPGAIADKVVLKDGTVLNGKIQREDKDNGFVYILVTGERDPRIIVTGDIKRMERDADAPKAETPKVEAPKAVEAKPAAPAKDDAVVPAKPKEETKARSTSGATRVAILNFGPPSDWQGKYGNMVGTVINATSWKNAIPLLEKDKVDVVVVRINSGGGMLAEMQPFQDLFENEYKKCFRTVGWVESAISCAAMSPYVLEEFYFMPEGNMGACTGWYGALQAMKGVDLEMVLAQMERASARGKRDYRIMRSMEIQEPLSCNIDENGTVTWFQDATSGKYLVNRPNEILTFTAKDAVKFKFARGIAATKEELAKEMGLQEVEWVGQEAIAYIDNNMKENDHAEHKFSDIFTKYQLAVKGAESAPDKQRRGAELGVANRYLNEMEKIMSLNPNFALMNGVQDPKTWFRDQREYLKELARKP